jgi:hypothetical protein
MLQPAALLFIDAPGVKICYAASGTFCALTIASHRGSLLQSKIYYIFSLSLYASTLPLLSERLKNVPGINEGIPESAY